MEEKKFRLEIEDKQKMREFELENLTTQAEIDTQKDVEITAPKTGTCKNFDLLKLLNHYNSANGDICMFLLLYEKSSISNKNYQSRMCVVSIKLITVRNSYYIHKKKRTGNKEYIKYLFLKRLKMSL